MKKRKNKQDHWAFGKLLFLFIGSIALFSCGINSSMMFKSPKGEYASNDTIPMSPKSDYRISIEDRLTFTLSTNEGARLIDQMSGIIAGANVSGGKALVADRKPSFKEQIVKLLQRKSDS